MHVGSTQDTENFYLSKITGEPIAPADTTTKRDAVARMGTSRLESSTYSTPTALVPLQNKSELKKRPPYYARRTQRECGRLGVW